MAVNEARASAIASQPVFNPYDIDLNKLIGIESSWDTRAYNKKSKARGLAQITPIALRDYNQLNPADQHSLDDLYNPQINQKIAQWTLAERIPQMLKAYGVPLTQDNVLWAYNAGIGRVVDNFMPAETKDYIRKYKER